MGKIPLNWELHCTLKSCAFYKLKIPVKNFHSFFHSMTEAYAPLSRCQSSCYDNRNKFMFSSTELDTWQMGGSINWLQSFSEVTVSKFR